MTYQYTTLRLFGGLTKKVETEWPGILNDMARQGWRLVAVDQSNAFFERPVSQ